MTRTKEVPAVPRRTRTAAPSRGWLGRRRRLGAVIVSVVVSLLASLTAMLGATPAAAATVDTSAWYVLVNRNSGKALDVYNLATNDGARITQWSRNDQAQQQWQF
ncbi:RICIN domain-containing protein, partial [Streptomyces sp. 4N509B]|uniref:RICIN domain-containing protein n=1 Tax=Streptomyces sp. 4N509B TaxID=3457413 RepID=UPI003FCFF324